MRFTVHKESFGARRGELCTPHGVVQTPAFMNVGTQAAIKGGLSAPDLKALGCQVFLANTYHLHLRPGAEVIRLLGGLHRFMAWDGPILTDSGGFQVFSLAKLRKIEEDGVTFNSHIDGRLIHLRPEDAMAIQASLGSDIAMAFDECVSNPAPYDYVSRAAARTLRWLERCSREWRRQLEVSPVNPGQVLWAINQGGVYDDLRLENLKGLLELDLPGVAIGGLAVGEETEVMYHILDVLSPHLPADKPHYLMGVGTPANILEAVYRGVDIFDCVMPARNARHGHLFTWQGVRNLKNEKYVRDDRPVDESCGCPVCRTHSLAYLRHLYKAGEILALRLGVMHNLYFYNHFLAEIRRSIDEDGFEGFYRSHRETLCRRI